MDTFDKYADDVYQDLINQGRGGPGNPFVFNQMDYLMTQAKREDILDKYNMLLKSGQIILEDYWRWNTHEYHKELVKYLNDFYIVITTGEEIVSVEKIENPTVDSIYIEYILASRLRGDEIDGDSIYDVRLECKWKDYIRKILCKNESHSLCES